MPIVCCHGCGNEQHVKPELLGLKVSCKSCQLRFVAEELSDEDAKRAPGRTSSTLKTVVISAALLLGLVTLCLAALTGLILVLKSSKNPNDVATVGSASSPSSRTDTVQPSDPPRVNAPFNNATPPTQRTVVDDKASKTAVLTGTVKHISQDIDSFLDAFTKDRKGNKPAKPAKAVIVLSLKNGSEVYCYFPDGSADQIEWLASMELGDTLVVRGNYDSQPTKELAIYTDCQLVSHTRRGQAVTKTEPKSPPTIVKPSPKPAPSPAITNPSPFDQSQASKTPAVTATPIFPRSEVRPAKKNPSTPGYYLRRINGFTVLISELAYDESDAADRRPLGYIEAELKRIEELLPRVTMAALSKVPIWVEWNHTIPDSVNAYGVYYGTRGDLLLDNGVDPRKANCVCLLSLKLAYELRIKGQSQRLVLLHELAHAVHELGFNQNPFIENAYDQAMARKLYDKVQHVDGSIRAGYASRNQNEYFAELTCAYLDRLDYTPLNRADLKKYDSVGYELMTKIWGTPEEIDARKRNDALVPKKK